MTKCVICERRPAVDNGTCGNCKAKIDSETRRHQPVKPVKFLVYHGMAVALVPNGKGTLKTVAINRNPDTLPENKLLNLNRYCEGYSRDMIKSFKKAVLQAHAC